ncbi:MAG: hypothetical protein ACE5FD_19820 [Anaerolineae bacterium]
MKTLPIAIVSPHGHLAVPPELTDLVALTSAQIFNEADVALIPRPGDGVVKEVTSYGAAVFKPGIDIEPYVETGAVSLCRRIKNALPPFANVSGKQFVG